MMSGMALNGPDALAQPQPDPNTMPLGDFQATDVRQFARLRAHKKLA